MTPKPSRSSLRSRVAPLTFGVGLALVAQVAGAAPADPPPRAERIELLWLDAAGTSGFVQTSPLVLGGTSSMTHFGPSVCGRSHRLGPATLELLRGALHRGQSVRIDAEPFGSSPPRACLVGVAVLASPPPLP